MSNALILSIICDAIGVVSFVMNLHFSKQPKAEKWRWVIIAIMLVISFGLTVYYCSELSRINNIHKQAGVIYDDYNGFGPNKEFIQESLIFLEENKDRYPDAYQRAIQIQEDMKKSDFIYNTDPAVEIRGIIKGIATLNGE